MSQFRKIHLFTHDDLDGYACEVVTEVYRQLLWEDTPLYVKHCNYGQIDICIKSAFDNCDIDRDKDLVIVADISWKRDNFELTAQLKSMSHLIIADHHRSSEWLMSEFEVCRENSEKWFRYIYAKEDKLCGCSALSMLLDQLVRSLDTYTDSIYNYTEYSELRKHITNFTEIVNAWDVDFSWTESVPSGTSIRNIYDCTSPILDALLQFNRKHFVKTIVKKIVRGKSLREVLRDHDFQDYLDQVMQDLAELTSKYYRMTIRSLSPEIPDTNAIVFVLPYNFSYKSVASFIAYSKVVKAGITDYDCLALWQSKDNKLSLRYSRDDIDLSKIAEASEGGGGGHPFAAGMNVVPDEMWHIVRHSRSYRLNA